MDQCEECVSAQTAGVGNPCAQDFILNGQNVAETVRFWCEEVMPPPMPPPTKPSAPVACNSLHTCKECEAHGEQQGIG